ncbi:MAG: hypothetical protein EXS64_01810 [Candidatus Latescibacteria bacterium]|nr:hypothetical protein [Candidatus Latescibacterota bacterium]
MSEERLKILKMLEEGKITVEEASRLIEAVESPAPARRAGEKAEFLRILVCENGQEKVKVNVPLALARIAMKAIPNSARQQINAQGLDIDQLLNGVVDSLKPGKLVEVQDGTDHVEIYLE